MKKHKLLFPILSMVGLTTIATPILATSCSATTISMTYTSTGWGFEYVSPTIEFKKGNIYNFELTIDSQDDEGIRCFGLESDDIEEYKITKKSVKVDGVEVETIDEECEFFFKSPVTKKGAKVFISVKVEEDCKAQGVAALGE